MSTVYVGDWEYGEGGWKYAVALMTILICHEMGHFIQARRYGVHSSFPYFIPMPVRPFGTFGAVILMRSRIGDRKALFDIGISGPLAGLVPTLLFCVLGLYWSKPALAFPPILQSGEGQFDLRGAAAVQMDVVVDPRPYPQSLRVNAGPRRLCRLGGDVYHGFELVPHRPT